MLFSQDSVKRNRLLQAAFLACAMLVGTGSAQAAYGKVPNSTVDSSIMQIDEDKFLGVSVARDYALQDSNGKELLLGDLLDKPLLLVLSYYSCDGACPAINDSLRTTLKGVSSWKLGQDYRVLTLSFDKNDTQENLEMFVHHSGFHDGLPEGWTMARFKNPTDIERLTGSIGFRFFWEPRDRVFLHPAAFVMVSPEARVTRFLYAGSIQASDIGISITKAYGSELSASNLVNFMVSACYSYNYHDGKYTLNYPMFIAVGALGLGVTSLVGGSILMKRREKK